MHEKSEDPEDDKYTEEDSVVFKLHIVCSKRDPKAPMVINPGVDEEKIYKNSNVLSGDLKWVPIGN